MLNLIASLMIVGPVPQRLLVESEVGARPVSHLFTVNADGTNLKDLGPGESGVWSPDGKRIAFVLPSPRKAATKKDPEDEPYDLYVVEADGTLRRKLASNISRFIAIAGWTGDSKAIIFGKGTPGDSFDEFWMMPLSASIPRKIGPSCIGEIFDLAPLPHSSSFVANISVGTSAKHEHILTFFSGQPAAGKPIGKGLFVQASPDGKSIAFERDGRLIVTQCDGTQMRDFGAMGDYGFFEWLPDSSGLIFDSKDSNSIAMTRTEGWPKVSLGSGLFGALTSPQSDRTISNSDEALIMCNLKTGQSEPVEDSENLIPHCWSADGSRFYATRYLDMKDRLEWYHASGRKGGIVIDNIGDEIGEHSFSADFAFIAMFDDKGIIVQKFEGGKRTLIPIRGEILDFSWALKPNRLGPCCDCEELSLALH